MTENQQPKDKIVGVLLCLFLGMWGGHCFYYGKIKTGVWKILMCLYGIILVVAGWDKIAPYITLYMGSMAEYKALMLYILSLCYWLFGVEIWNLVDLIMICCDKYDPAFKPNVLIWMIGLFMGVIFITFGGRSGVIALLLWYFGALSCMLIGLLYHSLGKRNPALSEAKRQEPERQTAGEEPAFKPTVWLIWMLGLFMGVELIAAGSSGQIIVGGLLTAMAFPFAVIVEGSVIYLVLLGLRKITNSPSIGKALQAFETYS